MAARRMYFPSAGSPAVSVTPDASWDQSSPNTHALVSTKSNTAIADHGTSENLNFACEVLISQFVSTETLPAGSVTGNFDIVARCRESALAANATLQCVIRVVSGDGTTVRGVLYSGPNSGTEFATTNTTRVLSGSLTPVTATAGDRLVVELGSFNNETSTTTRSTFINIGDPTAGTDFALTEGVTSADVPWIEFSNDPFAGSPTTINGGLATEADSALAGTVTAGTLVAGGLATETDAALAGSVVSGEQIAGGLATETDTALAGSVTVGAVVAGGIATETDTALAGSLNAPVVVAGGLALEADEALAGEVVLGYSETDSGNLVGGRTRSGYGVFTWSPPVAEPDAFPLMVHDYEKTQVFTAPTVVDGRVIPFSPFVVANARHRDRVLVGGRDVSFFRGVPTPTPSFRLVQPGLYGAGELVLPQVNALFEQLGTGDLSWLAIGKSVKVQRVDIDTGEVVAEDYCGFITGRPVRGSSSTFPLGGELTGRMALRHHQIPVFKTSADAGKIIYSTIYASAVRGVAQRPGVTTGITLRRFGGMNELEYFNELLAKTTHLNGNQWTVGLDANGLWETRLKDRTTIAATVYFDDARLVPDLDNDIAEVPNRVFATAIAPDGSKIDFRVYPGIKQGAPPAYPMAGNATFGQGTVDADTITGDGITAMVHRLLVMGYLGTGGIDYLYDAETTRAIKRLQDDAGLAQTGNVNVATWNALYDLDATGYSLQGATTLPAAQDPRVKPWNRTASGALTTRNALYDPHLPVVDHQIDLGPGFTVQQVRDYARDEMPGDGNWAGTLTCHFGLVRGEHNPGDPAPVAADVMSAREIRPGMNIWAPLFDGGTLFHVSGVEVPLGGRSPVLTLDTRARDTMKAWEVIQRNRDSRRNPARIWLNQYLSSRIQKDALGTWDKAGGVIDDRVRLVAGWNHFPVVAGQEGTLKKFQIRLNEDLEFCVALFGKRMSDRRMNHLIGNPLTEAGSERWEKPWVVNALESRVYLDSWGRHDQPAGYSPRKKIGESGNATGAPKTGVLTDYAQLSYHTFGEPVLWVSIWVPEACSVLPGRIMWQQLEEGS